VMLAIRDLSFAYESHRVLTGVSFDVREGHLCGLFGPNGCGKTTLFKCCLGLLDYEAGTLAIDGVEARRLGPRQRAHLVAYVPQEHRPPFPYLVRDVVLMGRTPHVGWLGRPRSRDRQAVLESLERVGITDLATAPYDELSGGQRQLVLVARAVAQQTPLILLDEPTSGLDFSNQVRIWTLLHDLARRGTTVFACSHDPNHVSWFCDRVVVMNRSGSVIEGSTKDVMTEVVLNDIYPETVGIHRVNGTSVVLPRQVLARGPGQQVPPLPPSPSS
jgi:iron complex transport system ATP-binding protein